MQWPDFSIMADLSDISQTKMELSLKIGKLQPHRVF